MSCPLSLPAGRWRHDPEDDRTADSGLDLTKEFRPPDLDCVDSADARVASAEGA